MCSLMRRQYVGCVQAVERWYYESFFMWSRVRIYGRTFFYFKFLVSIGKHLRDNESRSKRGGLFEVVKSVQCGSEVAPQ